MVRKLAWAFVAVFGVFLSSSAWAITTNVNLTTGGQPLRSTMLTIVVHRHNKIHHIPALTTQTGLLQKKITNDDETDITIDITYNGQTYYNIPITGTFELGGGGIIPFTTGNLTLDLYLTKMIGCLTYKENNLAGDQTSTGSACKDPVGGGFSLGYPLRPWNNNIQVTPFVAFEFPNTTVNYVFPNGFYLGTRSNWQGTLGVKVGPWINPTTQLYGVAGVSLLNETMTLSFSAGQSSASTTVPGLTLGIGGAVKPQWLQQWGRPVSLFAEVDWTWWQDAHYNTPTVSPAFNYTFQRTDTVVKAGVSIALGGQ